MLTTDKDIAIKVDPDSGIPLWVQLRNRLVYLIESGHLAEGDKLPTVREMAVNLGINYNTVSKVYQDIERDGYIVSKRGKGTFVANRGITYDGAVKSELDVLADEFISRCFELGMSADDISELLTCRMGVMKK